MSLDIIFIIQVRCFGANCSFAKRGCCPTPGCSFELDIAFRKASEVRAGREDNSGTILDSFDNHILFTLFKIKPKKGFSMQVDIAAEEMNNSIPSAVMIQGDISLTCEVLLAYLSGKYKCDFNNEWWQMLQESSRKNKVTVDVGIWDVPLLKLFKDISHFFCFSLQQMCTATTVPLNYYAVFRQIQKVIPKGGI